MRSKFYQIIPFGFSVLGIFSCVVLAETKTKEQSDWADRFKQAKAEGTIVISDERSEAKNLLVYNQERAQKMYSPASTFKIPHALFCLDSGVIRDEFQVIPWDGKKRSHTPWNRDQNLRSSMRHSVVWVYQKFAEDLGEAKELEYLEKIQYGNQDPTGKPPFWVNGNLQISAFQQVSFLQKLYHNKLPFDVANQRLVKDVMIVEAGPDWILRAKTGWNGKLGWWVGWVELPAGPVFFALNIDTPNKIKDLYKRELIVREILISLGALTPNPLVKSDKAQKPKGKKKTE